MLNVAVPSYISLTFNVYSPNNSYKQTYDIIFNVNGNAYKMHYLPLPQNITISMGYKDTVNGKCQIVNRAN